jgi:hypothetical protein
MIQITEHGMITKQTAVTIPIIPSVDIGDGITVMEGVIAGVTDGNSNDIMYEVDIPLVLVNVTFN